MKSIPQTTKKLLRRWSGIAYERELSDKLEKLYDLFHQWHAGSMRSFELTEAINVFREEAKQLERLHPLPDDLKVASAISRQILKLEELPAELVECLQPKLEMCNKE